MEKKVFTQVWNGGTHLAGSAENHIEAKVTWLTVHLTYCRLCAGKKNMTKWRRGLLGGNTRVSLLLSAKEQRKIELNNSQILSAYFASQIWVETCSNTWK